MGNESKTNESRIKQEYLVSVVMDERCLNGDDECPCTRKEVKRDYNPV